MTDNLQENEKKGFLKGLFIVIIAFLFIPIATMIMMYFTNEKFQYTTNNFLTILPGSLGGYFKALPTKEEKENIKLQVAKYYITLEEDRLLDKLLIIKGEDLELYNDLLILLSRENPIKMKDVKEELRKVQLQSDLLNRVLEEMEEDKKEKINGYIEYYTSLKLPETISELERTFKNGEIKSEELARFFEEIPKEESAKYLYYLDNALVEDIKFQIKNNNLKDIEKEIEVLKSKENQLKQLAKTYEKESLKVQFEDLGNANRFSTKDLAIIYKNISIKNAGRILSEVEDNDFITSLYEEINILEKLNREELDTTTYIAETLKIYQNYYEKVEELGEIYKKISLQELVDVIEGMVTSNRTFKKYTIALEEIIFTRENLAIDILRRLPSKRAAEVLEILKVERRIDLTQKFILN